MDPTRQPSAEGVNEFPMPLNVEEVKISVKNIVSIGYIVVNMFLRFS